jgi:hypothetical protein
MSIDGYLLCDPNTIEQWLQPLFYPDLHSAAGLHPAQVSEAFPTMEHQVLNRTQAVTLLKEWHKP